MCLEVFSYSIAGPPELYIGSNTNGSQFTQSMWRFRAPCTLGFYGRQYLELNTGVDKSSKICVRLRTNKYIFM